MSHRERFTSRDCRSSTICRTCDIRKRTPKKRIEWLEQQLKLLSGRAVRADNLRILEKRKSLLSSAYGQVDFAATTLDFYRRIFTAA